MSAKTVLITGGGSGIGRACAIEFARHGYAVVVAGRRPDPLAEVVWEIESDQASWVAADLSTAQGRREMVDHTVATFGRLDVVVNCAGVMHPARLENAEPTHVEEMISTNLTAPILLCQAALPALQQTKGSILLIGSMGGVRASRTSAAYGASKAGIHHAVKTLAWEFAEYGIRVNAVVPGPVDSGFAPDDVLQEIARATLVGRAGTPEDIARWVVFASDDASGWTNGSLILVDGGALAGS